MHATKSILVSLLVGVSALAAPGELPACPSSNGDCFGEVRYPSGEHYVGELRKFKLQGPGVLLAADGTLKQAGLWADGKLVTPSLVDLSPYLSEYPKFKASLAAAIKVVETRREEELVGKHLAAEPTSVPWMTRVEHAVANASKEWLEGTQAEQSADAPAAPPAPPQLTRESWESTKEFEARRATAMAAYQKEVDGIAAEARGKSVEQKRIAAQRAARAKRLPAIKRSFTDRAVALLDPRVTQASASFDPDREVLSVELSIEGAPAERYDFSGAPPELRKLALTSATAITYKPQFAVTPKGQVVIKAMAATSGTATTVGAPSKRR